MPSTISESLKTQFFFNPALNNTGVPQTILPSTNTPLKQSLQTKYPTAVISSYLEIKLLELRIRITSVDEWIPPASSLSGTGAPVEVNRDLVRSLWDGGRKQMDVYHKLGTSPARVRGSLSLLNKGDVYLYYLEDFLGILTNQSAYPVTAGEDILIALSDAGYGFLQGTDELLFTGLFTHYLTVINDAYLTVNGGVVELATFDQLQSVIANTTNLANAITSVNSFTASNTTAIENLEAVITELQLTIDSLISASNGSGGSGGSSGITKNYNAVNSGDDLITAIGTKNGTVAFSNPHPSAITVSASSIQIGDITQLTNRIDSDFLTTATPNSWVELDLGLLVAVKLTGLGLKSRIDNAAHPNNLTIEGSNDRSSYTQINIWSSIGFTSPYEWKYTTFTESLPYRYIRIRQPGLNANGTHFLGFSEINIYGTLTLSI